MNWNVFILHRFYKCIQSISIRYLFTFFFLDVLSTQSIMGQLLLKNNDNTKVSMNMFYHEGMRTNDTNTAIDSANP